MEGTVYGHHGIQVRIGLSRCLRRTILLEHCVRVVHAFTVNDSTLNASASLARIYENEGLPSTNLMLYFLTS
jgi:hypothetical protein